MHLHGCCWFLLPQIDLFNLIKEFNSSFHRLSSMSVFQLCMFKLVQHHTYMNYAVQVPSFLREKGRGGGEERLRID